MGVILLIDFGVIATVVLIGIVIGVVTVLANRKPEDKPPIVAETRTPVVDSPPSSQANPGADNLPRDHLERMKNLTVFIKSSRMRGQGQGTGFYFRKEGDHLYIATNDHVVFGEALPLKGTRLTTEASTVQVTVVFHSGTPAERSYPAEVIASDPASDLAILRVTGASTPAVPLDILTQAELVETASILVFGFPLGSVLGGGRNPAITVGKGSISSLRRDSQTRVALVQVQGDVNPGNSGGPVVDSQGRFVGVVVAKVNNSQIGFAIPAEKLRKLLDGAASLPGFTIKGGDSEQMQIQVDVDLFDPFDKVQQVKFAYKAGEHKLSDDSDANGSWPALVGAVDVTLQRNGRTFSGTFNVQRKDVLANTFTCQTVTQEATGSQIRGKPRVLEVPFRQAVVGRPPSAPPFTRPNSPQARPRPPENADGPKSLDHGTPVHALALSPDGQTLASACRERGVKLWNLAELTERTMLTNREGHSETSYVAFTPDGAYLLYASTSPFVRTFDLGKRREERSLPIETREDSPRVEGMSLSRDGRTLAVGTRSSDGRGIGEVHLWDIQSRELRRRWNAHPGGVRTLAFAPDGRTLASGGCDNLARLWDAASGKELQVLRGHKNDNSSYGTQVLGVAFSLDGTMLATASIDRTVKLWNVADGKPLGTLVGHTEIATGVTFSPDGKLLVGHGGDRTLRLWDVSEQRPRGSRSFYISHGLGPAVFSRDGKTLYLAHDTHVEVWPLDRLLDQNK